MSEAAARISAQPFPRPPDDEDVCAWFRGGPVKPRDIRVLHRWLSALSPDAALPACADALEAGAEWIDRSTARFTVLLDVLERVPAWRHAVAHAVATVVHDSDPVSLFELGLPNDRGLREETSDRLAHKLLPAPRDEKSLADLVGRMLPRRADVAWLAGLPGDLARRFAALVRESPTGDPWARARHGILETVALVATRTSALGLSREMRARSPEVTLAASPFFLLPRLCDALFSGVDTARAIREQIAACREVLEAVLRHLEEFGVSVDVVYRIEVIGKNLDRIDELLVLLGHHEGEPTEAAALVARLAGARLTERSLADVLRTNVHLLARKVIERAGESGEHYITATRREWLKMLGSAGGGGVLTAGTTAMKYLVSWGHFAPFVEGLFASANYAASFLVMQLLGFTLATKQPSMTAAALAGALGEREADDGSVSPAARLDDLVTMIARICRSQLAAAIGNVALVIPAAIAFHLLHLALTGRPFLDAAAAEYSIASLHPTRTGTIFYAALTGAFLWLSSLCAGWLENWVVYRRLPEAVADHRIARVVGRGATSWLARKLRHGVSGFGGNVSLGLLLGMSPVFGKFLGLPLDVRHITLSTGGLTLALCSTGSGHAGLQAAAIGIAIIGALNFGVSFALALVVAIRARSARGIGLRLLGAVLRRLLTSPLEFVFPRR